MPLFKDVVDVPAIIREAAATARPLLERKGLDLHVDIASDLPLVHADRLRIRQVLLNLLNNAVRFTDHGAVTVRALRGGSDDEEVVVEVRDTGIGIRPCDLAQLFRAFHQLDASPTKGRGGTGLGLVISKRFVELHGGRIWAHSDGPSRGATFTFAIPVRPDATSAPLSGATTQWWHLPPPGTTPAATVVVLDDDPAVVHFFERHLDGYRVVGAESTAEAVAAAERSGAHAIIADVPDGHGAEHARQTWLDLAARHGLRVLCCPMPSGRRIAQALGLTDYLVKPVTRSALLHAVGHAAPRAKTILVVDDHPQMLRLLCRMLRSSPRGYRLLRANDGEEGLAMVLRERPDLVVLDILMPGLDGLSVAERMRHSPESANIPVIAVSAKGPVEAVAPSGARTLCLHTSQPFALSDLVRAVRVTLDSLPPVASTSQRTDPARPEAPAG
jgi:CheY-like chemotaxis protein